MAKGKIAIDRERCKGCQLCLTVCPKGCIEIESGINKMGYYPACFRQKDGKEGCSGCTLCALICPDVAIEVYRD